jgi:hypothetical protein
LLKANKKSLKEKNIVENGVKHHNHHHLLSESECVCDYFMFLFCFSDWDLENRREA